MKKMVFGGIVALSAAGIIAASMFKGYAKTDYEHNNDDQMVERIDALGRHEFFFIIAETKADALCFSRTPDDGIAIVGADYYKILGECYKFHVGSDFDISEESFLNYPGSEKLKYYLKDQTIIFKFDDTLVTVKHVSGNRTIEEAAFSLDAGLISEIPMDIPQDKQENLYVDEDTITSASATVINKDKQIKITQSQNDDYATYIGKHRIFILSDATETNKHLQSLLDIDMVKSLDEVNGFKVYRLKDKTQKAIRRVGDSYIYFDCCTDHLLDGLDVEPKVLPVSEMVKKLKSENDYILIRKE